jgi:hypothetical protein
MAGSSYVLPAYQSEVNRLNGSINSSQNTYNSAKKAYDSIYNSGGADTSGYYNTGSYSDGTDQYPANQRWTKDQQDQMAGFKSLMDTAEKQAKSDKSGLSDARTRQSSVLSAFSPYLGDSFSQGLSQAYLTASQPQLLNQYGQARREANYALANQGNLFGSAQGGLSNQLQQLFQTNSKKLQDSANQYGQTALKSARQAANLAYLGSVSGADAPTVAKTFASPFESYGKNNPVPTLSDLFSGFVSGLSSGNKAFQANAGNGFGATPVLSQGQRINAGSGNQKMVN